VSRDLAFISWQFETIELPRDKAYLYKYFKTKIQEAFLKYIHVFGDFVHFSDHTGMHCSLRWLKMLHARMVCLEELHRRAKQGIDHFGGHDYESAMKTLAKIEKGKFKWNALPCE
jgi:hypothetical protein